MRAWLHALQVRNPHYYCYYYYYYYCYCYVIVSTYTLFDNGVSFQSAIRIAWPLTIYFTLFYENYRPI
jgi:hypothetical protein